MQIISPDGTVRTEAAAIQAYFGRQPGQSLSDFMKEIKELSPEGKTELAVGAAKELGWKVV